MAQIYTNGEKFQGSFLVNGMNPLDPRHQLQGLDSIFMDAAKFAAKGGLFNIAYRGMTVVVYDDDNVPTQLILNDPTPYTPADSFDNALVVDATTYTKFWTIVGQDIKDEIAVDVSAHFHQLDVSVNKNEQGIKTIDTSLATGKYKYYDDATVNDPNFATINKHGNLPAGTKVSDLMGMTISEILTSILFEVAYPTLQHHASATISWITTASSYGSVINNNTVLDVSRAFPNTTDFKIAYTPEQYKWVASDGVTSKSFNTTAQGSVTYHYHPDSGADVASENWTSLTIPEGVCQFYAKVNSIAGADALDSRDRDSSDGGATYYRKASDAAADSSNSVTTSYGAQYIGAWRYYSNASGTFTSSANAMSAAGTTPSVAFRGNDNQTLGEFVNGTTTIFVQWPQVKSDGSQKLYVYIPTNYKINANGVHQANTFSGKFDIALSFSQVDTTVVNINNTYNAAGKYYKWEITANAGITTAQIQIVKR